MLQLKIASVQSAPPFPCRQGCWNDGSARADTPDSPKTLPVWAVGRLKFAGAKAGTLPKQRRDDLDSFPTKVIFLLLS